MSLLICSYGLQGFACPVLLFNLTHVIFKHLLEDFEDTLDTEDRNDLCYPPHCVKPSIAGRARPSHAVGLTKPTGDTAVPSVAGRARPSHAARRVLQISHILSNIIIYFTYC